jgi:hypothetical protein
MLDEARKREKVANAFLLATLAASAAQSPKDFVRTGHVEAPGTALMQMLGKKRGEAERNLDHGRVSHPARNRKKKSVIESQEHKMKEVESKLPKGHKLKNERPGKGDHVFFDVVDDKGNAIQTPVPVGGAKKGKNRYSSSLKATATNAGNFIKKVHQAIDDVQSDKDQAPTTAKRMSAAYQKSMDEIPAKEKYKKASSILRKMKRKTFVEFVEEAYLISEGRHFSTKDELVKHHGGKLPEGTFIKNRGTKENPRYGIASVQAREKHKQDREERTKRATGQLTPREKAKVEYKHRLSAKRRGEVHHATEIETSGKEMKDMSPGDVLRHKKEQAKDKKYHGNDPKNLVVANKGPVSKFKPQQPGFHHGKFHAFERGNRKKLEDIGNVITPMRAYTTLVNKARRKTRRGED